MRRTSSGVNEEARRRHAWLELLQTSGPFLTLPVVNRVMPNFPAGVPQATVEQRATLRALIAEMLGNRGATRHKVIDSMLRNTLGWRQHLIIDDAVPESLTEVVPEYSVTLRPSFGYFDEQAEDADAEDSSEDAEDEQDDEDGDEGDGETTAAAGPELGGGSGPWKLLGMVTAWGTHPLTRTTTGNWTASAVERLAVVLRARDVPIGIITDGRWWALVWAPRGGTTGAAVWDSSVFGEELASFQAFVALLRI
jgi:hypothetical protein